MNTVQIHAAETRRRPLTADVPEEPDEVDTTSVDVVDDLWAGAWPAIHALVAADTANRAAEAEGHRWPVPADVVAALRAESDRAIAEALQTVPSPAVPTFTLR